MMEPTFRRSWKIIALGLAAGVASLRPKVPRQDASLRRGPDAVG